MSSLEEYEKKLQNLSDNELYQEAKSCIHLFAFTNYNNKKKIELIYSECVKRNIKIYEKALNDAYLSVPFDDDGFKQNETINIQRIDFMSQSEIIQFINIIKKSQKLGQFDIASASDLNVYQLLGIPKEFLMIFKITGNSMIDEGIEDGDYVIADRRVQITNNKIVVLEYLNELFIKRIVIEKGVIKLCSANEKIKPFEIKSRNDIKILAYVKNHIKFMQ